MTKIDTSRPESVLPTPSHTVGPFYGYALPFRGGEEIAPQGHPDTVTVHGYVLDGAGRPLPDALIELWGPDPDGSLPTADGSMRRDPAAGTYLGRTAWSSPAGAGSRPTPTGTGTRARCGPGRAGGTRRT
ncbi:hypothetical protein SFUMM280S_00264 [Streptomyces fumanus]